MNRRVWFPQYKYYQLPNPLHNSREWARFYNKDLADMDDRQLLKEAKRVEDAHAYGDLLANRWIFGTSPGEIIPLQEWLEERFQAILKELRKRGVA